MDSTSQTHAGPQEAFQGPLRASKLHPGDTIDGHRIIMVRKTPLTGVVTVTTEGPIYSLMADDMVSA